MEPVTAESVTDELTDRELLDLMFTLVHDIQGRVSGLDGTVTMLLNRFEPLLKKAENRRKIHDTLVGGQRAR